jgi:hypothetical protein
VANGKLAARARLKPHGRDSLRGEARSGLLLGGKVDLLWGAPIDTRFWESGQAVTRQGAVEEAMRYWLLP